MEWMLAGTKFKINKWWMLLFQLLSAIGFSLGLGESNGTFYIVLYATVSFFMNEAIFISIANAHLYNAVKKEFMVLFGVWMLQLISTILLYVISDKKTDVSGYWIATICSIVFTALFCVTVYLWIRENPNNVNVRGPQSVLPEEFKKWKTANKFAIFFAVFMMSLCFGYQARNFLSLVACAPKYAQLNWFEGSIECKKKDNGTTEVK